MTLDLSLAISGLSCLIAFISLFLSGYTIWKTLPSLSVSYNQEASLSFTAPATEKIKYNQKARCCLCLELANKAAVPISISKIYLRPHDRMGIKYFASPYTRVQGQDLPLDPNELTRLYIDKQFITPFRLDSFGIELGFAYFLIDEPRTFSAELIVETPWKIFSENVLITEFRTSSNKHNKDVENKRQA